jgi:hypothetical protein
VMTWQGPLPPWLDSLADETEKKLSETGLEIAAGLDDNRAVTAAGMSHSFWQSRYGSFKVLSPDVEPYCRVPFCVEP